MGLPPSEHTPHGKVPKHLPTRLGRRLLRGLDQPRRPSRIEANQHESTLDGVSPRNTARERDGDDCGAELEGARAPEVVGAVGELCVCDGGAEVVGWAVVGADGR